MRTRRRVRSSFLLLAVLAAFLGAGVGGPARAQDAAPTGDSLFGSYDLEARGLGVQARYEIEGLLPGGSPVLDLTIPETLARFGSGPTGYGLASLAYPGGLIVNLGSLLAQSGAPVDSSSVPDYPIKAEGFFPSGPTEATTQALGTQQVRTTSLGVDTLGTFPAIEADPVINVESIKSASRSSIEDGKAVSRTHVELGGVRILGGVIGIESLVTDLVAAHDGTTGMTDGGTKATGVTFLGLAAKLTDQGLILDEAPPVSGPGAPLGGILNPILDPLSPLTNPVRDILKGVLAQAVPSLNDVLSAAGISLSLLTPEQVTVDSGASAFRSSGLALGIDYEGKEQTQLQQLIDSIPAELKPAVGPLPNPISFLTENHIAGITLGLGTVSALASPPFDSDAGGADGGVDLGGETPSFDVPGGVDPGFSTPVPDLPGGRSDDTADLGDAIAALASGAVPAGLLIALFIALPFLGLLSTRLADNVLAPVSSTACPSGLDQPPAPPREP